MRRLRSVQDAAGPGARGDLGGCHRSVARCAPALQFEAGVAVVVDEFGGRHATAAPLVTPPHHRHECWAEGTTLGRESILVAKRALLIRRLLDDFRFDEETETIGEQIPSDPEVFLDAREAPDPSEEITNNEQCPPVADEVERPLDRAILVWCQRHGPHPREVGCDMQLTSDAIGDETVLRGGNRLS